MFRPLNARLVYLIYCGGTAVCYALIFTVYMIYQIEVAGLEPLQLVLIGTALEVGIFVFEIPTGVVADVYSRRLSVIIGIAITGIAFLLATVPTFAVMILAAGLWGFGYTFTSGAFDAWITDEIGVEAIGSLFNRGAQVGGLFGLIGIVLSGLIGSISLIMPILVGAVGFLLLALFLLACMPETGFHPTPKEERETFKALSTTFRDGLLAVHSQPILISVLLIGLFIGMSSEGFDRLWQKHVIDQFAIPALTGLQPVAWFALFDAMASILGILGNEVVRRVVNLSDVRAMARALMVMSSLLVFGWFAFALVRTLPLAMAAFLLIALMRGLYGTVYGAWINQYIPSKVRATVLSMSGQVDAVGQIAGGPIVGVVGSLSVRAALVFSGSMLTPILLLHGRILRRPVLETAAEAQEPTAA